MAQPTQLSFVGFHRAVARIAQIQDAVTRHLVSCALTILLNRAANGILPSTLFDLFFYVESMADFFGDKSQLAKLVSIPSSRPLMRDFGLDRIRSARAEFQNLAMIAIVRRRERGVASEGDFDIGFFLETMGVIFDNRDTLKAEIEKRDLRWFDDES